MLFNRRPKNPNEMTSDAKKYLKKFEKYLKKNKADFDFNDVGAIEFETENTDGSSYTVTVNAEEDMVWFITEINYKGGSDEASILRAINQTTGAKSPVLVHLEFDRAKLFFSMCFSVDNVDRDVESMMLTWWKYFEQTSQSVAAKTGLTLF